MNKTDESNDEEQHPDDKIDNPGGITERIEKTETGYRLSVKSKRGTGTNDRDEVKAELREEERPDRQTRMDLVSDVAGAMNLIRENQPDK